MSVKPYLLKLLWASVLLLAAVPGTAQGCPMTTAPPCTVDLVTGTTSATCDTGPYLQVLSPPADSDDDGWLEAVIGVDLTDECERVCVVLDYAGVPTDFTLNLGDSPTNNGFGGNAGGPESAAEVEIYGRLLRIWSGGITPGTVDPVAEALLQNVDGAYKVCVSNQRVTFGQPEGHASTPNSELLFALPDPYDGNTEVYVGLNRVIDDLTGAPSGGRTGTGLRRAYITLE